MRRTGSRNGRRDGGRKAQKRCSVLPEPGSGGSEMTSATDGKTLASNVKRGGGGDRQVKRGRQPVNQGGQRGGGGNAGQKKAAAGNLPPQGTLPCPVYWAMQMLTRFCSTPGKGWTVSPLPSAEMRSAAMPACSNAAATPAARCCESFRLRACEPVAASA